MACLCSPFSRKPGNLAALVINLADHFDFHQRRALFDEAEGLSGCIREVNDAVAGSGPVIVDRDPDGFTISKIGYAEFGSAGKLRMRGGELGGRVSPTASRLVPFKRLAVEGSVPAL